MRLMPPRAQTCHRAVGGWGRQSAGHSPVVLSNSSATGIGPSGHVVFADFDAAAVPIVLGAGIAHEASGLTLLKADDDRLVTTGRSTLKGRSLHDRWPLRPDALKP